jgi:cation-transporting P-type ATPase D
MGPKRGLKLPKQVLTKPPYYNCLMLAPDGQSLGYCDKKKTDWYLERGLAERLPDGSGIRLTFEPSGREGAGTGIARDNVCVVCGSADRLTKHHVVPRCYRVWLPDRMKMHNSYDLHAMCVACHAKYEPLAWVVKLSLAEEHGAPMDVETVDFAAVRAKGAANAILRHSHKIPPERRAILLAKVREWLGRDPSLEDMEDLAESDCQRHATGKKMHAQSVMEAVIGAGGERDFIMMWRRHFVDNMRPMFLPAEWCVDGDGSSRDRATA